MLVLLLFYFYFPLYLFLVFFLFMILWSNYKSITTQTQIQLLNPIPLSLLRPTDNSRPIFVCWFYWTQSKYTVHIHFHYTLSPSLVNPHSKLDSKAQAGNLIRLHAFWPKTCQCFAFFASRTKDLTLELNQVPFTLDLTLFINPHSALHRNPSAALHLARLTFPWTNSHSLDYPTIHKIQPRIGPLSSQAPFLSLTRFTLLTSFTYAHKRTFSVLTKL